MTTNYLVDQWKTQLSRVPELQKYAIPSIGRSYPMLAYADDALQLRYFYHYAEQIGPNSLELGAPDTRIAVSIDDFSLLREESNGVFDVEPFETTVYELTDDEMANKRKYVRRLKKLYDEMAKRYPKEASGQAGKDFLYVLEKLVPDVLVPYYRELSPDFVAWLET